MNNSGRMPFTGKTTRNEVILIACCLILLSGFLYQGFIPNHDIFFPR